MAIQVSCCVVMNLSDSFHFQLFNGVFVYVMKMGQPEKQTQRLMTSAESRGGRITPILYGSNGTNTTL